MTSTPSDIKALNVALDALCPASILKLKIPGCVGRSIVERARRERARNNRALKSRGTVSYMHIGFRERGKKIATVALAKDY